MKKNALLPALLLLLAACAYKLPEAQVLKIFEKHSFKAVEPEKLRSLIRKDGLDGLKTEDKYAEVLRAGRRLKVSRAAPAPAYGLLAGAWGGNVYVLKVFKGSPAETAGLREGDRLLAVNSELPGTEGFRRELAGNGALRIKAARRAKEGLSELETEVKPGEFRVPPIFGFYEPETASAFVRVGLLVKDSASTAAAGLAALRKYGAKNLILDLRGNRGGSPEEAAELLKLFAPKAGPVLALASRHPGYTRAFSAEGRGAMAGMRVIVLADGTTAMSAEVLAASLRELAGAAVAGGKTAGSVSVQKAFGLDGDRGLSITVARLVTPAGTDLEGSGLQPDSAVPAGEAGAWETLPADALLGDAAYLKALEMIRAGAPVSSRRRI